MYREPDLDLTAEQAALREAAHRFAAKVLRPTAAALDRLADPAEVIAERSPLWRALRDAYRLARAAYEAALAYARERVQGGKPICEHQLVQKRLFDMFTRVEACRAISRAAMVYNHATLPPATEYAIATKTFCTEAALAVANDALQLFGGNGLSRAYPIEKFLRDARASLIENESLIENGSNDVLALVGMGRLLRSAASVASGLRGAA